MATDYKEMLDLLPRGVWMSSSVMDHAWKTTTNSGRKYRTQQLVKKGLLLRKGNTGNTMYKVADKKFKPDPEPMVKPQLGSLNELINAVTKVGTENEILKKGLIEIQTIVNRTLLTM